VILLEVQMKNAQVKEIKLAIILDFRLEDFLGLLGRKLIFLSSSIYYHLYA